MTDHRPTPQDSSHATELRRRAGELAELARAIECSLVMTLTDDPLEAHPSDRRARLCRALLERNLHQLHRAADDLRTTAMRFRTHADELDAAVGAAA